MRSGSTKNPVGILAGWGQYPIVVAQSLKRHGIPVAVAAIRDHADPELEKIADSFRWFGIAKLGGYRRWFHQQHVRQVTMAGKIFKDRILFQGGGWLSHAPDFECMKTFFPHFVTRTRDNRDDTLLIAAVRSFERLGITMVPGTEIAPDLIAEEGNLTKTRPSFAILRDMDFGWEIAKRMGDLDIGQSVTIRDQTVLCVEAIEGTDACIARTSQVCPRGGFTLVKVAKPKQDMRFDLPTIGIQTLSRLVQSGGKAILVEAGKTILLDRVEVLRFADQHGIAIVARQNPQIGLVAA